jgi:hypothetical protein
MHDIVKILSTAERVVKGAIQLANEQGQGRGGAYFCVVDRWTDQVVLHALIGSGPNNQIPKWREFSSEMCIRLLRHPEHETSFESQNLANNQFPGAVRSTDYIFGLYGLRSLDDEAAMLQVAIRLGQRDRKATLDLIDEKRNPKLRRFLDVIHGTK